MGGARSPCDPCGLKGPAGVAPSIRPHRPESVTRTAAARDRGIHRETPRFQPRGPLSVTPHDELTVVLLGLPGYAALGHERGSLNAMCLTCGCMDAHKKMGENNIRFEDVKAAASENKRSVGETLRILEETLAKDRNGHQNEYRDHGS
jgi:hypothetical protein